MTRPRTPFRGEPPPTARERLDQARWNRRLAATKRLRLYGEVFSRDLAIWKSGASCCPECAAANWRLSEWHRTPRQRLIMRRWKRIPLAVKRLFDPNDLPF